jgi:hypothetical protein
MVHQVLKWHLAKLKGVVGPSAQSPEPRVIIAQARALSLPAPYRKEKIKT